MKIISILTILAILLLSLNITIQASNRNDECPIYGCFDADGNPRVVGEGIDIGAYEYQGEPTSIKEPKNFSIHISKSSAIIISLYLLVFMYLTLAHTEESK